MNATSIKNKISFSNSQHSKFLVDKKLISFIFIFRSKNHFEMAFYLFKRYFKNEEEIVRNANELKIEIHKNSQITFPSLKLCEFFDLENRISKITIEDYVTIRK